MKILIIKNFYFKEVKNPNELNLYNLNLLLCTLQFVVINLIHFYII